jgi:hypothetical protein
MRDEVKRIQGKKGPKFDNSDRILLVRIYFAHLFGIGCREHSAIKAVAILNGYRTAKSSANISHDNYAQGIS